MSPGAISCAEPARGHLEALSFGKIRGLLKGPDGLPTFPPTVLWSNGCAMDPTMLSDVARMTALTELRLKDVICHPHASLHFLQPLQELKTLEIDNCPQLTIRPPLQFPNMRLEKVFWGVRSVEEIHVDLLNASMADIHLVIYGEHTLIDLERFLGVRKLKELKFVDFDDSPFPGWIRDLPDLKCLSFVNGRLAASEGDNLAIFLRPFIPDSMTSLELSCDMDRPVIDGIFRHGCQLSSLVLKMNCIPDTLEIERCSHLRVLKLFAKELIEDVLEHVASLKDLEVLHFGGCFNLSARCLRFLHSLDLLNELCVSNCSLISGACAELTSLKVTTLEFNSCFGTSLVDVCKMSHLRALFVVNCMMSEAGLYELLACDLINKLSDFKVIVE